MSQYQMRRCGLLETGSYNTSYLPWLGLPFNTLKIYHRDVEIEGRHPFAAAAHAVLVSRLQAH